MFTKQRQSTCHTHPRRCRTCKFERKWILRFLILSILISFKLVAWYFGNWVGPNWWYMASACLGICLLAQATRRIIILILTSLCHFSTPILDTISFYTLTRNPNICQWYWSHEKLPLGPIRRRKKQLDDGWIVIRLAPWPDRFTSPWLKWLNLCISRRQDWKRCALGMYLYENMAVSDSPAPIECGVDGLEKGAIKKRTPGHLLFMELNSAKYHWPMRTRGGKSVFGSLVATDSDNSSRRF